MEGGRLVLRCAAVVASACQEEDDDDEPFEAIARLKVKPEEGRTLYFTRHGESEYNLQERIGGDPGLTRRGERYAKALGQYVNAMGQLSCGHARANRASFLCRFACQHLLNSYPLKKKKTFFVPFPSLSFLSPPRPFYPVIRLSAFQKFFLQDDLLATDIALVH